MSGKPPRGLFVTGTDTNVGKTYVACRIAGALVADGHRVGVYKPVASGCWRDADAEDADDLQSLHSDDADALWAAAGAIGELDAVCPQRFAAPAAPHVAARLEGRRIDAALLRSGLEYWTERCDVVVIEGVGGLMSPVSDDEYVADLAYDFGYPLVVVAPNVLGVINQTLQTLVTAAAFRDGISVAGVVLNDRRPPQRTSRDVSTESNFAELQSRCGPPLLEHVHWSETEPSETVDWFTLAKPSVRS